jgi:hypothetical protein
VAEAFFDRPCAANDATLYYSGSSERGVLFRRHVFGVAQPGVLGSLEVRGAIFAQFSNITMTRQVNGFCGSFDF